MDKVEIGSDALSATVALHGAELTALRDGGGRDLLWDGDPAFWNGRAPLLFPMVGRAFEDRNRIDGVDYPMAQHGFARRSDFTLEESGPEYCILSLRANAETRRQYPFEFALFVTYRIAAATLSSVARVVNEDDRALPLSFGFHPAFRWPLPFGGAREDHRLQFADPEPAPIRRLADGYLDPQPRPTPIAGDYLALNDALFEDGVVIFDAPRSRGLRYGVPGRTELELFFPDMPHLGVWTKPRAGFICLEPWQGFASPEGFAAEFAERPGVVTLVPGQARAFAITVGLAEALGDQPAM